MSHNTHRALILHDWQTFASSEWRIHGVGRVSQSCCHYRSNKSWFYRMVLLLTILWSFCPSEAVAIHECWNLSMSLRVYVCRWGQKSDGQQWHLFQNDWFKEGDLLLKYLGQEHATIYCVFFNRTLQHSGNNICHAQIDELYFVGVTRPG